MSARDRLLTLLEDPPPETRGPWLDLVDGAPGARGRVQDVWQSEGGAGGYDGVLALGDRLEGCLLYTSDAADE